MQISLELVEHIARLAKLSFSPEEKKRLAGELATILGYIEKLNELDTADIEPLSHASEITNVMRADETGPSLPVETALGNAPDRKDGFFKVPKVIK
ncbi:MAG: Asp-tRNA(Asn)/Glu-tRNA(Gln) amidotransferase subunit GatC [Calditrichaeota bacterium]|nr:Asp-tRNA(Asn)/Glu-tRNA(Gln) amidotransferase subunit GatC [Calditrichota bacterium]MCB0303529.1 Asp-tRNA(Asn)/Glu-tRNA(Gln) amidotransferase subunit GatC [Calditrichota bacterium]MCB0314159.1 Asp-tRNA(Asn)/Glu-tRNA(Gln) amidotransferase subunit GatC [Calditrichota bacterium]MCB9088669.1 Asp-tRNA(Asn)/Glu-tRNA(Gln) amidotransferase subunit GatC [Calditrichia bacterium]